MLQLLQLHRPTASPLITARWRLIYTTSESILGKTRPSIFRPVGPIYQVNNDLGDK